MLEIYGFLPETVARYVAWQHPARSAALLGVGTLTWFLLAVEKYTLLTLASYSALFYLICCFAYVNAIHLWATFTVPNELSKLREDLYPDDESWLTVDASEDALDALADAVNGALRSLRDVAYCRDNLTTLQTLGVLLCLAVIGYYIDLASLLYMGFLAAMTLPATYARHPHRFDQAWVLVVKRLLPGFVDQLTPLVEQIQVWTGLDADNSSEFDAQKYYGVQVVAVSDVDTERKPLSLSHPLADLSDAAAVSVSEDDEKEVSKTTPNSKENA